MRAQMRIGLMGFGLAFMLVMTGFAAPASAQTCAAGDTDCRLSQIERRLGLIERALTAGLGGGGGGYAADPISISSEVFCASGSQTCQREATSACSASGFGRGVPAETRLDSGYRYLVRATCLSEGPSGPVAVAADVFCASGTQTCQREATAVCTDAGFNRGAPSDTRLDSGYRYLTRATCLD